MWRRIFIILSVILFALLQCSVFPMIYLISTTPNLLLGLTISFAIMWGQRTGMFAGALCGLVLDLFNGTGLGVYVLIYVLFGYVGGWMNKTFFPEDIKLPLASIAIGDLLYGLCIYFVFFLLQGDFQFMHYLISVILPETIFTVVVMLVLYPIILKIHGKILESEKRNAKKFI